MSESVPALNILAVDDDPSTVRELETVLDDARVRFHFADTANAFSRVLEAESIELALIHLHADSRGLLEPLVRTLRAASPPLPLIALVAPETDAAQMAAHVGVNGCVRIDDARGVARILGERIGLMRENRAQRDQLLQASDIHERYNLLLESSREAIAYLHEGLHIYANPSYLELFGYKSFEELEGFSILDLLSSGDGKVDLKQLLKSLTRGELPDDALELDANRAGGRSFPATVQFAPAHYDGEACTQIMVRERQTGADNEELQRELEKLRSHDLLTGMINRQAFIRKLTEELERPPANRFMAVLLLALDNNSELQSRIGAAATDSLIQQTAEVFQGLVDDDLLPARWSDHVFAVRLWFGDRVEARELATRLVEGFSGRILEVRDKSPTVTASVGLALGGSQRFTADELLAQAESALKEAQRTGGNSYVRYRPSTDSGDGDETEKWAERIRHALNNQDFRLVRIPITSMEDDEFVLSEFETRMRIEGSDEIIMPSTYRPAAETAGLAVEIDRDLLNQMSRWRAEHAEEAGQVLLPLSGASMHDDEFSDELQRLVDAEILDGRRLVLGVRERDMEQNLRDFQRFVTRFSARGVRFALLDVTLDTKLELLLKNVEVQFVKLGGNILPALRNEEKARAALEQIAVCAGEHQAMVISPQVESTTDLAALWQFGITLVQDDFVSEDA